MGVWILRSRCFGRGWRIEGGAPSAARAPSIFVHLARLYPRPFKKIRSKLSAPDLNPGAAKSNARSFAKPFASRTAWLRSDLIRSLPCGMSPNVGGCDATPGEPV